MSLDDAIGEQVMGDVPIGGIRAEAFDAPDFWVFVDGVRSEAVQLGQVSGRRDIGQRGTLRLTLVSTPDQPVTPPAIGTLVQLSWRDHLQWAGVVENVRLRTQTGTADRVLEVQLDCASWERLAEQRLISETYTEQTTRAIFRDVITDILAAEGITEGVIDEGLTLSFAGPQQAGQQIRVNEFLRDVAEASGGVHEIDPFKRLHFRKTTVEQGAAQLTNIEAIQEVESSIERQEYRNVQVVKVRGTGGTEETVTRENAEEISARQAIEGGSGRHEQFDEIEHPSSNDSVELERLGIAAAIVKLNTFGQHQRTTTAEIDTPTYRLGDVVTVNFPEHQAAGTWQLAGMRFRALNDYLRMELELIQTSALQRAFQGWLKITQAGRALVQIPGTPIFETLVTFTANDTFVVPDAYGDGSPVEVEVASYAAGGGGGGGFPGFNPPFQFNGGTGGAGGKATSFRTLPVGTALTITVGTGGAAGVNDSTFPFDGNTDGSAGTLTKVEQGATLICRGDPGAGGGRVTDADGPAGAPGSGVGDFVADGGAANGGAGFSGAAGTGPAAGGNGRVEIRY